MNVAGAGPSAEVGLRDRDTFAELQPLPICSAVTKQPTPQELVSPPHQNLYLILRSSKSSATAASSASVTPRPTAIRLAVAQRGLPLPFSMRETWLGSSPTRRASALCVSPFSVRSLRTAQAKPRCGSLPLVTPAANALRASNAIAGSSSTSKRTGQSPCGRPFNDGGNSKEFESLLRFRLRSIWPTRRCPSSGRLPLGLPNYGLKG
jgi:hypothetical protein